MTTSEKLIGVLYHYGIFSGMLIIILVGLGLFLILIDKDDKTVHTVVSWFKYKPVNIFMLVAIGATIFSQNYVQQMLKESIEISESKIKEESYLLDRLGDCTTDGLMLMDLLKGCEIKDTE